MKPDWQKVIESKGESLDLQKMAELLRRYRTISNPYQIVRSSAVEEFTSRGPWDFGNPPRLIWVYAGRS